MSESLMKKYPSIDLLWSETRGRIDRQLVEANDLSTKAGIVLGFTGVVLERFHDARPSAWLVVALVAAGMTGFCAIQGLRSRRYIDGIEIMKTRDLVTWEDEDAKYQLVDDLLKHIETNASLNIERGGWVLMAIVSFAFTAVLLVIASYPGGTK